jgi:hypothetical protein
MHQAVRWEELGIALGTSTGRCYHWEKRSAALEKHRAPPRRTRDNTWETPRSCTANTRNSTPGTALEMHLGHRQPG